MQKENDIKRKKSILMERPTAVGGANPQEVKDLKIKVSHKDKEIRELQAKLKNQQVFLDQKDKLLKEGEQERDNLMMQNEAMGAKLKENNLEIDGKGMQQKAAVSSNLVDQYKAKLQKCQREIDTKIREMQEKDHKIAEIKSQAEKTDRMLKKHMNENNQLKKQINSGGFSKVSDVGIEAQSKPEKRDFKTMRAQRKQNAQKSIEEFNQKFLTDLQGQIDTMFTNVTNKREKKLDNQLDTSSSQDTSQDQTMDTTLNKTATEDEGK